MNRRAGADLDTTLFDGASDESVVPPLTQAEFVPMPVLDRRGRSPQQRVAARYALFSLAVFGALVTAAILLLPHSLARAAVGPLAAAWALCALVSAVATRLPQQQHPAAAVASILATIVLGACTSLASGLGPLAPGLAIYGLLVALAWLVSGGGAAAAVSVTALVVVTMLALAPAWVPGLPARVLPVPLLPAVLLQWASVGMGYAVGWAFSRLAAHHRREADERERRFSGLLAIAADGYWEIDAQYRLVALEDPRNPDSMRVGPGVLGRVPWEMPQFGCDSEILDALLADLDTRVAFRELPAHWRMQQGTLRHFHLSGEPRFDARGLFRGYWGVAREVTAHVQARQALAATEGRYQELFSRIPTALILHRDGVVIDANPAAVELLGYDELRSLLGRDMLEHIESGDSRERARRRLEILESIPTGEALPVTDFRMRSRQARRIAVRATAVRVEAEEGPAMLSILVDDTERRRAEEAVRRSEALLSHLVATSPDVITLTDLATGRYAMVNHTFERVTGYPAAEVVGRTSLELGIWADTAQREAFVNLVRERGSATEMPCTFVAKDGHTVQLLVSGAVFAMDRRTYLVINGRDISVQERSRLERDAILQNASIGIAVTRDRRFVLTNPRFDQMYGWPEGALVGQLGSAVWPSDEDYAALGEEIGPLLARGELAELERPARRRDGSTFMARVLGKAIDPSRATVGGTIWIVEDITERRQVAQTLARARDQAEAANRAKSAFLANTSHELRTPLNGMLGLAQLARDRTLPEERRQKYLDQIVDNAQALAAILSDVLDLSKIEAGKLVLEATSFDLPELLAGLRQAYGALAAGRGLALEVDIDASVRENHGGYVRGDPLRVRQILSNYLSNALKFTEQGGVRLSARRVGDDRIRFEVIDTGPGIDAPVQALLFRPFTQADQSTTRRFGGTGLGLSICHELAQLMGGEVGVSSEAGRGSCFWAEVVLPAVPAPPEQPDSPALQNLQGLRVLLVEDNPVNMLIGVALLERWGVVVAQAHDGQEAVQAVQDAADAGQPYQVVLMDLQMPVMSGFEATRELRRRPCGASLPVLALTAAALVSERDQAREAGMDDFITKPIDADRLRETVSKWAAGRHLPAMPAA
ncbi:MAG: PAS domain S-box protein [Rubrivivax sp.]|nr:PAS domain S-box protein [Rubrivivax sp.]